MEWYYVFVDLDWPLNASRRLSASAKLLVIIGAGSLVVEIATALAGQAQQW